MGSGVTVYRTHDEAEILEVLQNPAILEAITEQGGDLKLDTNASCFVAAKVDDELAAVFIFDKVGAVTLEVHAHVLPHKRHLSKDLGAAIMRYIINYAQWAKKYVAQVPFCYESVREYACSFGMQIEGINRESYLKNDKLHNQWHLGATAQEIRDGLY